MTYYHSPLIQNLSLLLWWKCRISTFYGARPTFDTLRVLGHLDKYIRTRYTLGFSDWLQ